MRGRRYSTPVVAAKRSISAFPWQALDHLDRRTESALQRGRRYVERAARPAELAASLGRLVGGQVEIHFRTLTSRPPATLLRLGFSVASQATEWSVGVEPALASTLLAKLLRRPAAIVQPEPAPEPAVLGALSALIVETARGAGASEALVPLGLRASGTSNDVAVLATVLVDGRPYSAALWLPSTPYALPASLASAQELLAALADVELSLPLVVAQCLATPALLGELVAGAAFCPAAGWTIDANGHGRGVLVAGNSERGLGVELGPSQKIVVREAESVPVAIDSNASTPSTVPSDAADAVLDAPLVVRVEMGQISMLAREWAALRPGDVIGTGQRIGEPVVLRAGGRVLARGELVNLEGELALRIIELSSKDAGDGAR